MPTDKVKKPNTSVTTSGSSQTIYSFPRPCLQCEDYVSIVPGFALEILANKGEHKGYVHLTGRCREDWPKNHPTDRREKIAS
jgi:hypothetical protein